VPHCLINGLPQSGKSTYAQLHCRLIGSRIGRSCVYNPFGAAGWRSTIPPFDDPDQLIGFLRSQPAPTSTYIEESGLSLGRDPNFHLLTNASHHWGNYCYLLSQDPTMLHPVLRRGCDSLVTFAAVPVSAELLAEQFNDPQIAELCPNLPRFHYLKKLPFSPLVMGRIDLRRPTFIEWPATEIKTRSAR